MDLLGWQLVLNMLRRMMLLHLMHLLDLLDMSILNSTSSLPILTISIALLFHL